MFTTFECKRQVSQLFYRDSSGTVAVMFGLIFFVLMAVTGAAIDSSRIALLVSRTNSALDAAALAAARDLSLNNTSDAQIEALALAYFDANLRAQNMNEGRQENFTITINREKSEITLSTDVVLETALGRVVHIGQHKQNLSSQAVYSARDIELGMMLDVSGSMGGAKVVELRNAAKELAKIILDDSRAPTRNKIGIAPYSTAVNAGVFAELATNSPKEPVNNCVTERPGGLAYTDKNPFAGAMGKKAGTCTDSTILPLTNQLSLIESHVDTLDTGGTTAGHLGISWAWYIVSPEWAAFWPSESQPKPYFDPAVMKAVIIMTDGEFNTAYENGNGNSTFQSEKLCKNMKDAGVLVFAVGFEAPPAALAVLQQCASKPEYFFDAQNGAQLRDAFASMAREMTGLRLTM